jgi:hypothetical protein
LQALGGLTPFSTPVARLFAAAVLAVAVLAPGHAADDFKPDAGFHSLFNGTDLTGWKFKKADLEGKTATGNKRFQVKDGIIIANVGNGIEDLYTVKDYNHDFHLKLDFRAAPRADSGVYIRGKQLQVRDYPTVGPYHPKGFKTGDWNELEIIVRGQKALCKCNGEVLEKAFAVPARGGIGLQAEAGKFEFRHIQVKERE